MLFRSDLVEATELADLLTGKQIPVCMLNACQSGKQLGDGAGQGLDYRETSLGSRLMAAGMQMVVAMSYSVLVTAAEVLMTELYRSLFAGKDLEEAMRLGRRELFNQKARSAYFGMSIDLEDWLLPVVYGAQKVDLKLRKFEAAEEEVYLELTGSQYRFTQPEYRFVGRDVDILRLERGLLAHNVLLLQGMGGTGKTTLLGYLRDWWQRTNFAEQVFYFGYDAKAWTLEQMVFEMGQKLYGRFETFSSLSAEAKTQKVVGSLKASRHILILDNLESVTGQALAIQNTLDEREQGRLRDFLVRLVGGKSRVVLGSRGGEEWLRGAFGTNVYRLQGLDPEARSLLGRQILERYVPERAVRLQEDADFGRLMGLLAGYPLAMEVVLGNLRSRSPRQVLEDLLAAEVDLDVVSADKTKSVLRCVEYSHSNLSPDAQKLLLCLAPFSGFVFWNGLPKYVEQLQKLEPFRGYDFAGFDAAVQEAVDWGLLSPREEC